MSEQPPPQEPDSGEPVPAERRRSSTWVVLVLLVLLAGWFVFTQVYSHGGQKIQWYNDLAAAEAAAKTEHRRIFLLLYEPGCQDTAANDRNLFSQRFVKKRLARMVCCRVQVEPLDPLLTRFRPRKLPVMMVLEPGSDRPVFQPLEGRVDQLQFETYVLP